MPDDYNTKIYTPGSDTTQLIVFKSMHENISEMDSLQ